MMALEEALSAVMSSPPRSAMPCIRGSTRPTGRPGAMEVQSRMPHSQATYIFAWLPVPMLPVVGICILSGGLDRHATAGQARYILYLRHWTTLWETPFPAAAVYHGVGRRRRGS